MTDSNSQLKSTNAPQQSFRIWDIAALGLFLTALSTYFWPLIIGKAALFYFDVTELNYAYRHAFAENLKAGRIAFWCHNLYNGFPLYSESQTGYWHPLKFILYPFLSTWYAFSCDMILSLALAGLGTYTWLRRHAHPAGALTGALIVTFGGFTWAHFVHTSMINALASVPWIIWGLERSWRNGRLGGSSVAAFALACQVFAGHLQDAVFSVQLIALLTAYQVIVHRDFKTRRWVIICGSMAILAGVLIAAVQWIPSYELLKRTPRTEGLSWLDQTFGSWHPQLLPTLFVREAYGTRSRDTDWMDGFYPYHEMNAYVGATAMLLALLGARQWRRPWVGMWVFIGFVSAVFMLGRFTIVMDFWHHIPILGSSRIPVRYHLWATMATAALASQGISSLLTSEEKVRSLKQVWIISLTALLGITLFAWTMITWWTDASRWKTTYHTERNQWLSIELAVSAIRSASLFLISLALIRAMKRSRTIHMKNALAMVLAIVVGVDLIASHWQDMPTIAPTFWTKPPAAAGFIKNDPKASRVMGIPKYSAGEPGYASKPVDFFAPRDALGWSLPLAYGLESNIGETPFRPARLIRLTDLAGGGPWRFSIEGVTHLVSGQKIPINITPIVADSAFVYRLPEPEPRFHWAPSVKIVPNDQSAELPLKDLGEKNTTSVLVVESSTIPDSELITNRPFFTQGITSTAFENDSIKLELATQEASWLRIGVSFDPGWRATLDGNPIEIHPAQLAFMAVRIPEGQHKLMLNYRPAYFRLGLAVTFTGLMLVIGSLILVRSTPFDNSREVLTPAWLAPRTLAVSLIVLLAVSAVAYKPGMGMGFSSRWDNSWHQFTWGAGLEAMRK